MPMYPEVMLAPMREELVKAGVTEMRTAEEVATVLDKKAGTTLVIVNSNEKGVKV